MKKLVMTILPLVLLTGCYFGHAPKCNEGIYNTEKTKKYEIKGKHKKKVEKSEKSTVPPVIHFNDVA